MPVKTVRITKAVAGAENYAADDVVSESVSAGTAWIFQQMGGSGYIVKAQVICETNGLTHVLTLYLFDTLPTSELNDNEANTALLHADIANYLGKIDFPALAEQGGDSEAIVTPGVAGNLPLAFNTKTPEDTIWGILVTDGAITGEAAGEDYTVILSVSPSV